MADEHDRSAGRLTNLGPLVEAALALVEAAEDEVLRGRGRRPLTSPVRPGLVTWKPGDSLIEKALALIKVAKELDAPQPSAPQGADGPAPSGGALQ